MKRYNRNNNKNDNRFNESQYSYEYEIYSLWYDRWDDDWYDMDDDWYDSEYGSNGLRWYYENKEIFERNRIINEILGERDDDYFSFNALNF